jgi:hypothetical protein
VDEGADGGGDDLDVCTETQDSTIRFSFDPPSSDPATGAGAQTIDLIMSCTDADTDNAEDCTGNPTFSVELYCGSTPTGTSPFSATAITAVDQDHSTTFTYPAGCATDGSNLEFHFTLGRSGGSPGSRRWAAIEAVEWEVTHATAGPARRVISVH